MHFYDSLWKYRGSILVYAMPMLRTWMVHDLNIISRPRVPTFGMYSRITLYRPLGIIGTSAMSHLGSKPMPRNATFSSSAIAFTWYKWLFTSPQVWWRVETGAPLSSNCPPGSSVTLCPSSLQPMIMPSSIIGSHPKRLTNLFSTSLICE